VLRYLAFVIMLTLTCSTSARAQEAVPVATATTCWLAGMAFSPGATIRAGAGVTLCQADGTWAKSDGDAAGCFKDGELYAVGVSMATDGTKVSKEVCRRDGTWH
jgi:hypothetical protein